MRTKVSAIGRRRVEDPGFASPGEVPLVVLARRPVLEDDDAIGVVLIAVKPDAAAPFEGQRVGQDLLQPRLEVLGPTRLELEIQDHYDTHRFPSRGHRP
jgi:hypothetical protein